MNHSYTKLYGDNFFLIQLIQSRLMEKGINSIIKDETESGRLAGFSSDIKGFQELYIQEKDLSVARTVIEEIEQDLAD